MTRRVVDVWKKKDLPIQGEEIESTDVSLTHLGIEISSVMSLFLSSLYHYILDCIGLTFYSWTRGYDGLSLVEIYSMAVAVQQ